MLEIAQCVRGCSGGSPPTNVARESLPILLTISPDAHPLSDATAVALASARAWPSDSVLSAVGKFSIDSSKFTYAHKESELCVNICKSQESERSSNSDRSTVRSKSPTSFSTPMIIMISCGPACSCVLSLLHTEHAPFHTINAIVHTNSHPM